MRLFVLVSVFVVFTAYTITVMVGHGVLGFVTLAGREPWALQVLLDLLLMLSLFSVWVFRDAKKRNLPAWPYALLSLTMGSVGALVYLIRREIADRRSSSSLK